MFNPLKFIFYFIFTYDRIKIIKTCFLFKIAFKSLKVFIQKNNAMNKRYMFL